MLSRLSPRTRKKFESTGLSSSAAMHWSLFASCVSMQFKIRSLNPSLCAVAVIDAAVAIATNAETIATSR